MKNIIIALALVILIIALNIAGAMTGLLFSIIAGFAFLWFLVTVFNEEIDDDSDESDRA